MSAKQQDPSAEDVQYSIGNMNKVTSNVTGHHRGRKRKLWAGYRAPSLKRTSLCDYFSSSSVLLCAFSALCMYSKLRHHPHPLGYLCAKVRFFRGLHRWAGPWRKIAYSPTQSLSYPAYLMPLEPKLALPYNKANHLRLPTAENSSKLKHQTQQ